MIYIKRSDGAYLAFEGMTQDQIAAMLADQAMSYDVITQEAYEAAATPPNATGA